MTPALATAKRALRSEIKKSLSMLSAESVQLQSQTCLQTLFGLPEYEAAKRLSVFLSMPAKEIDTTAIVTDLLQQNKTTFVPYIHRNSKSHLLPTITPSTSTSTPPGIMDMFSLSSLEDYQSLKRDSWGIPTIPDDSIPNRKNALDPAVEPLDLILMPGVAFDENFRRLGHGKGYYDYFLTRYKEAKLSGRFPVLVALAFKEQVLNRDMTVPTDESDWSIDIILTGDGRCLRK